MSSKILLSHILTAIGDIFVFAHLSIHFPSKIQASV